MKKMLTAGLMALGLVLASQQTAPAWVNFKVGVGFNWQFQSGGNSLLWGLWEDGQVPSPHFHGPAPVHNVYQPVHVDMGHPHGIVPPHYNHSAPPPNWTPPAPHSVDPAAGHRVPAAYPAVGQGHYSFENYYHPASWDGW